MPDYTPNSYCTWTTSGSRNDMTADIWFGEQEQIEWYDPATTPWQELYHEEDYQGIADQLLAEELGYA